METENLLTELQRFQDLVLETPELLKRLQVADAETFVGLMVELGRASHYTFGEEDVRTALQTARRAWLERGVQ